MTEDRVPHEHSFILQQGSTCRCGAMTEDRVPTPEPRYMLLRDRLIEHAPAPMVDQLIREVLAEQPAPPFDAERLRMRAERVIASFDWSDGSLPIITDDPIAFGNAVNRLRDALVRFGSAPSRSDPEPR